MGNIIEIRNLKKVYKRFSLCIDKIEIQEGTITGLIGKNGAGKTTLINCLMNIIDSTYDEYTFNQKELNYTDFEFRAEIGYVGDSFDAYQNIKLYLKILSVNLKIKSKARSLISGLVLMTNKVEFLNCVKW